MDNKKKLDDLEKQIKDLKILVANLTKKVTTQNSMIKTLKVKVANLESNVNHGRNR